MPVITVFNQKGGVGKTTTSVNLAAGMSRRKQDPLLIDLDPQAHLTYVVDVEVEGNSNSVFSFFQRSRTLRELIIDTPGNQRIVPAHLDLAKADAMFGKGYNVVTRLATGLRAESFGDDEEPVVIDCSPMLGVLSLNALFACDIVVIPISADYLALNGAMQMEKTLKALEHVLKKRMARRYLLTRYDKRLKMSRDIQAAAKERFGDDLARTTICEDVRVAESPALRRSVFDHAPNCRGARDYMNFLDELADLNFGQEKPDYLKSVMSSGTSSAVMRPLSPMASPAKAPISSLS